MSFNFYSCISLAVALSVLSFTVQTNAQPQAAPPDPQVWTLDFQNNHCIISTGEVARAGLALWMTPGDPDPTLDLVGSPNIVPAARSVTDQNRTPFTITFSPGGETFQSTAFELSNGGKQRAVELRRLHRDFAAAFAKSDELTARSLQKTVSVPTLGSAKAMAALHQCLDQKLAQWGVDVASYDALRMPPTDDFDHPWITYQDYPEQALASDQSGQVVVRLNVDEAGKVTGCAVVGQQRLALDPSSDMQCRDKEGSVHSGDRPRWAADCGDPHLGGGLQTVRLRVLGWVLLPPRHSPRLASALLSCGRQQIPGTVRAATTPPLPQPR